MYTIIRNNLNVILMGPTTGIKQKNIKIQIGQIMAGYQVLKFFLALNSATERENESGNCHKNVSLRVPWIS